METDRPGTLGTPSTAGALAGIRDAAVAIARGAGCILREGQAAIENQRNAALQFKTSEIDPVTEYDIRSEQYIVGELSQRFPSHRILGEEGGDYSLGSPRSTDQEYTWYIDPLDGTVNFAHGFPLFCVSMGLWIDGVPAVGVVYNPATEEIFAAAHGHGATRNGRPIRVSATPVLKLALVTTGFSYDTHSSDSNIKNFLGFQRSAQATRRIGSATLNLCYTATGQMDGHWEMKTKPHDIAAGIVLVREAGGTVTDFDGGENMLDSGCIVASNGIIHRQMLDVLKAAGEQE
jgi:myo-inositol-1(or 4)-monophosphatase